MTLIYSRGFAARRYETLDGALPHFCVEHHTTTLCPTIFGAEFRLHKHFSHPKPPQLRIFIPLSSGFYIFYFIFSTVEKKSWWGKTELYRQSLTSPFHIKCCTIFCRQLSRIFLPENRSGLGRWYILENVVCFRFSCSSRGDNVHSLHQLSLRSYDGRTL